MRLPLANTLRNRDSTTDKDARLLNCVVDTKKRVIKRPSLVANYEVTTPGQGLGLFVRNVPKTPDGDDDSELIVIAGSILTTNPAVFNSFTLTSANIFGDGSAFGFVTNRSDCDITSESGGISPDSFNGVEFDFFESEIGAQITNLGFRGDVPSTFFTSLTFGATTLLASAAVRASISCGVTRFRWSSTYLITGTGTFSFTIA